MRNSAASPAASAARRPKRIRRDHLNQIGDEDAEDREGAKTDYEIRSVANALDLLEAICMEESHEPQAGEDEVRVTQLSERLGINKSAVYRLLMTFEKRGYVERIAESGIYRIGASAFETGCRLLLRMGVLRHARPVMEDLCRRCNEAVYLAIRRGGEFLFIDLVESAQQVKIVSLAGKRFPLAAAAPGQVLLAYQNAGEEAIPAPVVSGIRRNGYHFEQGGLDEMISCLAAPLFDSCGAVAGALCVIGPAFRMPQSQVESQYWPLLKDASEAVSSKLGYLKPYAGRIRL